MRIQARHLIIGVVFGLFMGGHVAAAHPPASSTSPHLRESTILQRERATNRHGIVVGLQLRNRDELEQLLADLQNPDSPNYGHFLTQEEFNARFGPTPEAEQRAVDHLHANGLTVTDRFSNRLLVGATGSVDALERTFGVEMHNVLFRGETHYAAINEPTWPADLSDSVVGVIGLDDLTAMHAHSRRTPLAVTPRAAIGASCCHLSPSDLSLFYDNSDSYIGTGQTLIIAGAYAWSDTDIATFNSQWGLPALPSGSGQVCTGSTSSSGCSFNRTNSDEVSLDVQYSHGTAPGTVILNYMSASTSSAAFVTMYNRIVSDNPGHVVTTSWGSCEAGTATATQKTDDNIFINGTAIGQSWFAASGDSGSRDCTNHTIISVDHPANSPHVMGVGGTSLTCSSGMTGDSPACGGYGSETAWSDSGGGASQVFTRPAFQSGCAVPSGMQRLVPDVSLEAAGSPGNYVAFNGAWYVVYGTSGAAPQWGAFFTELNQKVGGSGLGNPGARLYGLCGTGAFHDITTGSNGDYSAGVGYDMTTGLGSPDAANLLGLPSTPTGTPTSTSASMASPTLTPTPSSTPATTNTTDTPTATGTTPAQATPTTPTAASTSTPAQSPTQTLLALAVRGNSKNPKTDRSGCQVEWYVTNPHRPLDRYGLPKLEQICVDGDPSCDFKSAEAGVCSFQVVVCMNNDDPHLPDCLPNGISKVTVRSPRLLRSGTAALRATVAADLASLQGGLSHLLDPQNLAAGYVTAPPLDTTQQNFCSAPFQIDVLLPGTRRKSVTLMTRSLDDRIPAPRVALSKLKLTCAPPLVP